MLASEEADYKYPGQQAPMVCMTSGGEFYNSGNCFHWADHKQPLFIIPT